MSTFLNRLREHFTDVLHIFRNELVKVVKDEGVLMFLVVVPLGYPLLYSWIYNNETLHETPVVVVDQSHSALSRQFINDCDASPDVHIKYYAEDLDEARSLISRQLVRGIYLIPSDFAECVNRGEQAHVSVYCDMSLMLAYKAVYQTAMVEAGRLGAGMNIKRAGNYTKREDAITAQPLAVDDVAMFNPSGGYGSCVLPAVLMLILQQAIALGIGMAAGTARERHKNGQLIPDDDPHYRGAYRIVWGKALCYGMIGAVAAAYLSMAVPAMFSFPQLGTGWTLFWMLLPYTLACVFFGLTVSCLVRYRENVMLLMVFVSVPLLFMTGVSWPQSSIPGYWQGVSWLFPSTFGVRAFIRVNSMGASVSQVLPELRILWIQAAVYLGMACLVFRHQFRLMKRAFLKTILPAVFTVLLSSCGGVFDIHPYDVNIDGDKGINERQMAVIESKFANKDTLRVAFISDTHLWLADAKDQVADLNSRKNIDFVVHCGDLTDTATNTEFEWSRDILNGLNYPWVALIGNHDFLGTGDQTYRVMYGELDFAFIAGRVKFVCLNTNATEYDYLAAVPNFDFLEEQFTTDTDKFDRTVLVMHAPPFSEQFNNNVCKAFRRYLDFAPGLLCCVYGHEHADKVSDLYGDGLMFYGIDCAEHRNYRLMTITPDGYEIEQIRF